MPAKTKNKNINWFKLNRSLHRDIGYFCIGMTLVFSISGIAVNHIDDWNPNYRVSHTVTSLPGVAKYIDSTELDTFLTTSLDMSAPIRTHFWVSPNEYKLFLQGETNIVVDFSKERAIIEQIEPRTVFKALNLLHLNEIKQAWSYFSDMFAGLLIFLAISSLFMVKGRKGVLGKRGLYVVAGFLIPLGFILIYSA